MCTRECAPSFQLHTRHQRPLTRSPHLLQRASTGWHGAKQWQRVGGLVLRTVGSNLVSPHDGETSNAGELNVNTKVRPYPSTGSIATTQRAGAWVIEPLSEAGFVAIILSRHVDCRLWEHKWMAWWPSAQAQQLKCAHACLNARVRVPCKRAAHLHASEQALGPAAACARERCREIACICA